MATIKAVLNQAGIAMELHNHAEHTQPVMLALVRPAQFDAYRRRLAESNPDMMHATLGQLAIWIANLMFAGVAPGVVVDQSPWTYNASEDTYTRA